MPVTTALRSASDSIPSMSCENAHVSATACSRLPPAMELCSPMGEALQAFHVIVRLRRRPFSL